MTDHPLTGVPPFLPPPQAQPAAEPGPRRRTVPPARSEPLDDAHALISMVKFAPHPHDDGRA